MTSERLNEMLVATPFHPFDIRLADGRAIRVQHPEFIAPSPSGRTAVVFQHDDSMTILDVFLAVSLDPVSTRRGGSEARLGVETDEFPKEAEMPIVLNCPSCRQPYQMSPEQIAKYAGRTITCRKCKHPFAFDAAMDAAAQAAGQAEPEEESHAAAEGGHEHDAGHAVATVAPPLPPRRPAPPAPQPAYSPPPVQAPAQPAAGYAAPSYAAPAAEPAAYEPPVEPDGGIGDFFVFRRMALPTILPAVFWIGVAYCVYNGLRQLMSLLLVPVLRGKGNSAHRVVEIVLQGFAERAFTYAGFYAVIDALFWFILGPLFWRGFCELVLAASRFMASNRK